MSIFLESPNRKAFNGNKEENAIREIYYQHWEKMKNEIVWTRNEINRWRQKSIAHINKHADQEIQILNTYCTRQRDVFDESRRANIDIAIAYAYHGAKQPDLFDQLQNACRTLEFQTAKLEIIKDSIQYIKVITVGDHTKTECENSIIKQSTNSDDNLYKNLSLSSNPAITSSDRTNRQSSVIETSSNDDLWVVIDDNQKTISTKDDGLNNKCPICFMIYPASMNHHDRSLHVNQHYRDDDDNN